MESNTELELLKMRVVLLEKQVDEVVKEIKWAKYGLIAILLAESPQALTAIKTLIGLG